MWASSWQSTTRRRSSDQRSASVGTMTTERHQPQVIGMHTRSARSNRTRCRRLREAALSSSCSCHVASPISDARCTRRWARHAAIPDRPMPRMTPTSHRPTNSVGHDSVPRYLGPSEFHGSPPVIARTPRGSGAATPGRGSSSRRDGSTGLRDTPVPPLRGTATVSSSLLVADTLSRAEQN